MKWGFVESPNLYLLAIFRTQKYDFFIMPDGVLVFILDLSDPEKGTLKPVWVIEHLRQKIPAPELHENVATSRPYK